ncbi:MAG: anti-sigma factor family protein [Acidimicrobiales bacterium]
MTGRFSLGADGHLGDWLSPLVDGELSPGQTDEAMAHLACCGTCSEELAAIGNIRRLVRRLESVPLPDQVNLTTRTRALGQGRRASGYRWRTAAACLAIGASSVGAAVGMSASWSASRPVPTTPNPSANSTGVESPAAANALVAGTSRTGPFRPGWGPPLAIPMGFGP